MRKCRLTAKGVVEVGTILKVWNMVQVSGSMAEGASVHLPQVYYRRMRKASPEPLLRLRLG
jgi:hypothetical protein